MNWKHLGIAAGALAVSAFLPGTAGQAASQNAACASERGLYDTFHFTSTCMRKLRDQWNRAGNTPAAQAAMAKRVRAAVEERIGRRDVAYWGIGARATGGDGLARFERAVASGQAGSAMVAEVNSLGQPWMGMGQTGLAYFMFVFSNLADKGGYPGHEADARFYRALGEAMVRPVLTPASQGGLMTRTACRGTGGSCAWFHSVTREDRPSDFGATLNQDLHVLRDLEMFGRLHRQFGWRPAMDYDGALRDGLDQLFAQAPRQRAGEEPTLADYLTPPQGRRGAQWLYYGFNPDRPAGQGGYFLSNRGKNCQYQVRSLSLVATLLEEVGKDRRWQPAQALSCDGALAKAYRGTRIRMGSDDAAAWSGPGLAIEATCDARTRRTFAAIDRSFYSRAFARCGF